MHEERESIYFRSKVSVIDKYLRFSVMACADLINIYIFLAPVSINYV